MTMISTSQNLINQTAFNSYVKYLAYKRHFTTKSYDFHKYNGKVKANFETFRTRNDAYFFAKLANKPDYENMILANMVVNPDNGQHPHIGKLLLQKKITLETFTMLAHMSNIYSYWSEKVVDKIIFYDIIIKSKKYKPFLRYDEQRFKQIVKDKFF